MEKKTNLLRRKKLLKGIFGNLAKSYVLIITGQSGAGKETLREGIKRIAPAAFPVSYIVGTGDEFRMRIPTFTLGMRTRLQEIQDTGQLQSGDLAAAVVIMTILEEWDGKGLLVLEGSPRTIVEAEALHRFITTVLQKRIVIVNLHTSDALATERLMKRHQLEKKKGGAVRKETSNLVAIKTKLKFYYEHVLQAFLHMRGDLHGVVGFQVTVSRKKSPRDVLEEVIGRMPVSDTLS